LQPIPRDDDDDDDNESDTKVEQQEELSFQHHCIQSPQPWKGVLELADLLLSPGGYLLQYDVPRYDFASTPVMNDYVASHSLSLQIIQCYEPIDYRNPQVGRMFMMLWQKQ
jgi:hypothetical protein